VIIVLSISTVRNRGIFDNIFLPYLAVTGLTASASFGPFINVELLPRALQIQEDLDAVIKLYKNEALAFSYH
jgi:hypothetical protein